MEKIIVYVDDAEYALQQLAPMECSPPGQRQPIHWILVAGMGAVLILASE